MNQVYLEMTYRKGTAQAAYLYLPRRAGDASVRTVVTARGLVVDFAADGRAIGIEIPSPSAGTRDAVNEALEHAGQPPIEPADLAPLRVA